MLLLRYSNPSEYRQNILHEKTKMMGLLGSEMIRYDNTYNYLHKRYICDKWTYRNATVYIIFCIVSHG